MIFLGFDNFVWVDNSPSVWLIFGVSPWSDRVCGEVFFRLRWIWRLVLWGLLQEFIVVYCWSVCAPFKSVYQCCWLSSGLVNSVIYWLGFHRLALRFLQHRGRQSTGDRESCWGEGRSGRSTSAMTQTQAASWPPSRFPLTPTVKRQARWEVCIKKPLRSGTNASLIHRFPL